jgi:hypothetical protein
MQILKTDLHDWVSQLFKGKLQRNLSHPCRQIRGRLGNNPPHPPSKVFSLTRRYIPQKLLHLMHLHVKII